MAANVAFSLGVDRLFRDLRAYSTTGTACFPRALEGNGVRRQPHETLHAWFVRVIDSFSPSSTKSCAVEDNIAVFAVVEWTRHTLKYANIQVLVATCDLDDFYFGQQADAQYLRLDLDEQTLGDPFSHPLPHIHAGDGCSARFALDGGSSVNVVADFIDFVYRHYAPQQWRRWVEREWNRHFENLSVDGEDENPINRIFEAFDSNQFDVLRDMEASLTGLKVVLRQRKDQIYRLHMERSSRELLGYPVSR
jgi:hypothetical protein